MRTAHERVRDQFGAVAANYTASVGHANEQALRKVIELVRPDPSDALLDVAAGSGNAALAFAPMVQRAVALDLTPEMLDQVRANAEKRGLANVETALGEAEALPFEDESFDIVTNRLAAHHFADIRAAIRETARVLRPGGKFLVVDIVVPEDGEVARQVNEIELLRDPSHVRNLPPSEWRLLLDAAGFDAESLEVGWWAEGLRLEFEDWTRRIGTPAENLAELRARFENASAALKESLDIQVTPEEISFLLPEVTILARKAFNP